MGEPGLAGLHTSKYRARSMSVATRAIWRSRVGAVPGSSADVLLFETAIVIYSACSQ